jgi:putative transposase
VLTDGQGMPLSIVAAPANRHDMKLVAESLASTMIEPATPHPWRQLRMDLGYDYRAVRNEVWGAGLVPWIEGRGEELRRRRRNGTRARRWVVERTHNWLNRFRWLLIRWEKRADTNVAMLHFACGLITWRFALSK